MAEISGVRDTLQVFTFWANFQSFDSNRTFLWYKSTVFAPKKKSMVKKKVRKIDILLPTRKEIIDNFSYDSRLGFAIFNVVAMALYFVFTFVYAAIGKYHVSFMAFLSFAIATVSYLVFRRRGPNVWAGNILILSAFLVLFGTALVAGGINSPGLSWFMVAIALGTFILDKKSSVFWAIALSCGGAVLYFGSRIGLTILNDFSPEQTSLLRLIHLICAIATMLVFSLSYQFFKDNSIRELKKKQGELKAAFDELQISDLALDGKFQENAKLIRVLAHDLSNPLSIISTSLLVLEHLGNSQIEPHRQRMRRATETIIDILNYVREIQAVNSGKKEFKPQAVSIEEMVEKAQFMFKEKLRDKNLKLRFSKETWSSHCLISAEPVTFSNNVLNNLVSNAIKFSFPGSVIEIRVTENPDNIHLQVIDTGVGVPAEVAKNLFSTAKQTSRLGTSGEKGTGFGMPLVKSYVDLYGAQIKIESKVKRENESDHGTTIHLFLPKWRETKAA